MPESCNCTPGQNVGGRQTEAIAQAPAILTTEGGDFGLSAGTVELIGNSGHPPARIPVDIWTPKAIAFRFLDNNPAPGSTTFTVRVTPSYQGAPTYEATGVRVTSLLGSGGYPPTHDPVSGHPLTVKVTA